MLHAQTLAVLPRGARSVFDHLPDGLHAVIGVVEATALHNPFNGGLDDSGFDSGEVEAAGAFADVCGGQVSKVVEELVVGDRGQLWCIGVVFWF